MTAAWASMAWQCPTESSPSAVFALMETRSAQKPKLAPYVPQMREALANILGIGADRVSIKAKTAEGLDSVGHCQAIEAHAAVILFPKDEA